MEDFIKWFGFFGTLFGIILGFIGTYFSWNAWRESQKANEFLEREKTRSNETIKFILSDGSREYEILPSLRRREVTRSEVQGRLGTIPRKDKKSPVYNIKYTSKNQYYEQIDQIMNGSNEVGQTSLVIECEKDEFDQFVFAPDVIKNLQSSIKKTNKLK